MIYLKTRRTFRTYKQIDEVSFDLCLDSYEDDGGSVVVPGPAADMDDVGAWLIHSGRVFLISSVVPGEERTTIKTAPPGAIFDRPVVYPGASTTTAAFLAGVITSGWIAQTDPMYQVSALRISIGTSRAMIKPDEVIAAEEALEEGETLGVVLFDLAAYLRKLRSSFDVFLDFDFAGDDLTVQICEHTYAERNIVFADGASILDKEAYGGTDTVAKVTVLCNGAATDFYLDEYGDIQTSVPTARVQGRWATVIAPDEAEEDEIAEAAARAFGDGAGAHKVEFWSDTELALGDAAVMRLRGRRVIGCISRIDRRSDDLRNHYTTGDLVTTITEMIRKRGKT